MIGKRILRGLFGLVVPLVTLPALAAANAPLKPSEALAQSGKTGRVDSGQKFFADGKYAGSESCKSCHEKQHGDWTKSWHAKMERWPSPAIIVGDFDNRTVQFKNLRIRNKEGKEETINPAALAFRKGDKFFFTLIDQDNPANNQTWEIGKVLGGNWDQGYEVKFGEDNFIPAPLRWSVGQKDWIVGGFNPQDWFIADGTPDGRPFRPEEMPMNRVAEAKCNGCHTTGFTYAKNDKGIWKTQAHGKGEIGIACESCHGPGARHVDEANSAKAAGMPLLAGKTAIVNPLTDLNAEQATQICAQCHVRGTHKEVTDLSFQTGHLPGDTELTTRYRLWSFSGTNNKTESAYFWRNDWAARNRQQYQDFTKSGHYAKAGMSCLTCHSLHGDTESRHLRRKPADLCVDCHRADGRAKLPNAEMFAGSEMQEAGVTCADCHMAKIGSRSRATGKSGHQWDTTSHVFAVATPLLEKNLGVRSACTACHAGEGKKLPSGTKAPGYTQQELIDKMTLRGNDLREAIDATQALLAQANPKKPGVSELLYEARAKLDFVLMDNSKGIHNPQRAKKLVKEAKTLAERALNL